MTNILPSEVKAALRRQANDILATTLTTSVVYRNLYVGFTTMGATEVKIYGIDEAIDKLLAVVQPEIERLEMEARLNELLRHSHGKGEVSSYSVNRRIAELREQLTHPKQQEEKQ